MEEITKVLEELKSVTGKTDVQSEVRKKELTQWIADHKEGHEKEIDAFMESWLADMETENEEIKQVALREQISDKAYKLIPWSYIAKNYFGKSVMVDATCQRLPCQRQGLHFDRRSKENTEPRTLRNRHIHRLISYCVVYVDIYFTPPRRRASDGAFQSSHTNLDNCTQ